MQLRRVVTGHNAQGQSVFETDKVFEGERHVDVWATDVSPANNLDDRDGGELKRGLGGTGLRVGEIEPGHRGEMHRTRSLDYCIVVAGEIDMEVDTGEVVKLKAGDVLIQRGTHHAWINNGSVPARVAWILVDAEPIKIGDEVLPFRG